MTYSEISNALRYLTAMKRHDLRPGQCIVIEDSTRGLAATTAAGLDCIIVLSKWTSDGDFANAVAVIEDIAGVPAVIQGRVSAS